eukprot:8766676-Pyramimonas_sp.AAC.1
MAHRAPALGGKRRTWTGAWGMRRRMRGINIEDDEVKRATNKRRGTLRRETRRGWRRRRRRRRTLR